MGGFYHTELMSQAKEAKCYENKHKKGVKFNENYKPLSRFEQGTGVNLRWVFILQAQGHLASASPA